MLVYRDDPSADPIAISQVAHAWVAWQLAEHWGNRRFARPAPRAEVLAAVLLHDVGWTELDAAPPVDGDGRPLTFDRMPPVEHVAIWRACIARSALHTRYAALLVASHFAGLAAKKSADLLERDDTPGARLVEAFRAETDRLRDTWREELAADARYEASLEGDGWTANARLLAACDRLAVFLCAALGPPIEAEAQGAEGETEMVELIPAGSRRWRVRPWPLQGDRLRLQCEGRRLKTLTYASPDELHEALQQAPTVRLSFELLRPSAR